MQFLGPAEKGKYANGSLVLQFSRKNLSGMNLSGSGNTTGFLCKPNGKSIAKVPRGMIVVPSVGQIIEIIVFSYKEYSLRYICNFISLQPNGKSF